MAAAKVKFFERHWLNNDEVEGGSAFIRVDKDEIKIADCNRIVNLNFWCDEEASEKELTNLEFKIDILYDVVKRYRQFTRRKITRIRKEKKENN